MCDIFVHYDDVQFIKRHFMDRVQIPVSNKISWMSVPKLKSSQKTIINDIKIDYSSPWQKSHINLLNQAYRKARFKDEMLNLVESVFSKNHKYLSDLTIESIMSVSEYFNLSEGKKFDRSSEIRTVGKGSGRLLNIIKHYKSDRYLTAMGALKYLDFELFESNNISVEFIDYKKVPYTQQNFGFNPYVSILDLIACHGKDGAKYICSGSIHWKDFINSQSAFPGKPA